MKEKKSKKRQKLRQKKEIKVPNLPSTQCAAVITHLELITTAPQLWLPWNLNPACNNAMGFFFLLMKQNFF